jgi:NAD-dependent SIR2 family protein deacetylase
MLLEIERMVKNRNIVIFAGAGFSRDVGLPTMAGFGKESIRELKEQRKLATRRESGKMYLEAGNIFKDFCLSCSSAKMYLDIDIHNMETIFCIAEAMKEAGVENISLNGYKLAVDLIIEKIKLWLWKIYHQCRLVNKNKFKAEPYQKLVDIFKNNKLMSSLSVVTTNYDLVFEYIAWKQGFSCMYPILDYKPLPVTKNKENYIAEDYDDQAPLVCKLHGSINYFMKTNNNGKLNGELFICKDIAKKGEYVGKSYVATDRPAILPVDALWKLRQSNPDIVPAIVPPTYSKLKGNEWLRRIWNAAYEALKNAELLIFIGYSMPDSDGFMRALVQSAMATREPLKELNICLIDPEAKNELGEKYKNLFFPLRRSIRFIPKSFSQSLENMQEILSAYKK